MVVLLAALSAGTFGVSDFLGGLSARRMPAAMATVCAQFTGLVLLVLISSFVFTGEQGATDIARGLAAGVCAGSALTLFYWAMARGPMSVVAPVSAVLSGLIPVIAGFVAGERPQMLTLVGIVFALPAIVLISREPTPTEAIASSVTVDAMDHLPAPPRRLIGIGGLPVLAAALSGVGFGGFFVFLARTTDASGLWPLAYARGAAVLVALVVAIGTVSVRLNRPGLRLALGAGLLDVLGNSAYLIAARQGLLSVVGVIGAMYPASTVVLARIVLRERLALHQLVGLAIAVGAVALIALGG